MRPSAKTCLRLDLYLLNTNTYLSSNDVKFVTSDHKFPLFTLSMSQRPFFSYQYTLRPPPPFSATCKPTDTSSSQLFPSATTGLSQRSEVTLIYCCKAVPSHDAQLENSTGPHLASLHRPTHQIPSGWWAYSSLTYNKATGKSSKYRVLQIFLRRLDWDIGLTIAKSPKRSSLVVGRRIQHDKCTYKMMLNYCWNYVYVQNVSNTLLSCPKWHFTLFSRQERV